MRSAHWRISNEKNEPTIFPTFNYILYPGLILYSYLSLDFFSGR